MATTLSLIIIFLPIAFMTGYARKYVNSFGWTMAMAILVSLLVAFTLTPMMSSRLLKVDEKEKEAARPRLLHRVEECYLKHAALVTGAPAHHCGDLRGDVSLHFRPVSPRRTRLDSRRRSIRAAEFLHACRKAPPGEDHANGHGHGCAKSRRCRKFRSCRAYTHGPTNHAHLFIGLVPRNQRKRTPRADGDEGARHSRRTIATSPTTCACLRCSAAKFISRSPPSFAGRI